MRFRPCALSCDTMALNKLLAAYSRVDNGPQKDIAKSQPPEPVHVILSGKRVFADVIR